ncbi:MAG: hypothetical protein JWP85_1561 [Rhodoglobus sp.]|nr:hypothetical protein [Rhodoglobus sp.]
MTMPTITRTWVAFAAIGTGLIHVALVIGSPLPLGIVLAVVGLVEFGWGVLAFARETVAFPRVALVLAIAPVVLWGLLLVSSAISDTPELAGSLGLVPLGIATLFELFIAGVLAVHLRRSDPEQPPRPPSISRYLVGLVVGGLAVAGFTTPALAATGVGTFAQPHGEQAPPGEELFLPGHGH